MTLKADELQALYDEYLVVPSDGPMTAADRFIERAPEIIALLRAIEAIDIEYEGQTYKIVDPMMVVTLAKDRLKMIKELERLALLSAPIEFSWKRLLSWR